MTKAEPLNTSQIDVIRAQTLNDLGVAQEALEKAAYAAALPGGDEKAMLKARDAVHILELKVQGLAAARKDAEAEERRQADERNAAARRELALKIRSEMGDHRANLMGVSNAMNALREANAACDQTADSLRRHVFALALDDDAMMSKAQTALGAVGAFGNNNVSFHVSNMLNSNPLDMYYLMTGGGQSLAVLAGIVPEIMDDAVIAQAEADADARAIEDIVKREASIREEADKLAAGLATLNKA